MNVFCIYPQESIFLEEHGECSSPVRPGFPGRSEHGMDNTLDFHLYYECYGECAHDYAQILIPMEQTLYIEIGTDRYEVTSRELCFIPPRLTHRCSYPDRLMVINIPRAALERRMLVLLTEPLILTIRSQVMQLIDLIQAELKQNPDSKSVFCLYNYLYSKLLEHCTAPSIRYISEYYHLPITVNQLAKIESYNAAYYSDWFKQHTGFAPSIYIRFLRINRAKELLKDTSFSVMEIAVMVGYSSNSTFTRAFHNITGMTPKAYRETYCAANAT